MADYKTMYHVMFNAVTDAERKLQDAAIILQTAQQNCEDIYTEEDDAPIMLIDESNTAKELPNNGD